MICDFIKAESIIYELEGKERDEVLAELTEKLIYLNSNLKREDVFNALVQREEKMSTLVAKDLAVPHIVSSSVSETVICIGISHKGVEFNMESSNKEENSAKLIFCIVFPEDKPDEHLQILKEILLLIKEPMFMESILKAQNGSEIIDIIQNSGD